MPRGRRTERTPDQDLLKRVEGLEQSFTAFKTEFVKVVNDLGESVKKNVQQVWENQKAMAEHLKLIDQQVMILVELLEAHGLKVPAPGEGLHAKPDKSEAETG